MSLLIGARSTRSLDLFLIEFMLIIGKISLSQPAITCSKLTRETLEQGVKYVQSWMPVVLLMSLLLTLNIFRTLCVSIVNFEQVNAIRDVFHFPVLILEYFYNQLIYQFLLVFTYLNSAKFTISRVFLSKYCYEFLQPVSNTSYLI